MTYIEIMLTILGAAIAIILQLIYLVLKDIEVTFRDETERLRDKAWGK